MSIHSAEDMLPLSGVQHYVFCPRQWALIHVEQQWLDNRLTAEGHILHRQVDDPEYRQKNGASITLRSVPVASHTLGLQGLTDAVELCPAPPGGAGMRHPAYPGLWQPRPVEYKHGRDKAGDCDRVQLCAQAICLEEMWGVDIPQASLFYARTRRRVEVAIDSDLRQLTRQVAREMHSVYDQGLTPPARKQPHCRSCSLFDLCLPQLCQKEAPSAYLQNKLYSPDE